MLLFKNEIRYYKYKSMYDMFAYSIICLNRTSLTVQRFLKVFFGLYNFILLDCNYIAP